MNDGLPGLLETASRAVATASWYHYSGDSILDNAEDNPRSEFFVSIARAVIKAVREYDAVLEGASAGAEMVSCFPATDPKEGPEMAYTFTPSQRLAAEGLLRGHIIQGGMVLDHLGVVWHEFATHAEALAAVEAFRRGVDVGKEIGADDARKTIRDALGVASPHKIY